MTLSRPRTTGRVLRGSALGLGLFVAGSITAPAAFAVEEPVDSSSTDSPEAAVSSPAPLEEVPAEVAATMAPALSGVFGSGKDFTAQVRPYGPVPDDLDLSGAVFLATPQAQPDSSAELPDALADDPAGYTCTTDVDGRCTFHGPNEGAFPFPFPFPGIPRLLTADRVDVDVPTGTYVLTQVSSSPGLAPATGSSTFTVCDGECEYPFGITGLVGNDSLFRTSLVTTVIDADTQVPLACAGYELTGPDYPHDGTEPAASPVTGTLPAECVTPTTTAPTTSATPSSATPSSTTPSTTTATTTAPETTDEPDPTDPTSTSPGTSTSPSSSIVLDLAADDEPLVTFGTQTSDATGTMTFPGWFFPGDGYLLTPTTTPAGYGADVTDGFGITTTAEQAAAEEPATVTRALVTGLAAGAPAPATTSGAVAAATTTAATATAPATASGAEAALAVTGTPVGTIALLGTGLVVLGGGALAAGTVSRRRARIDA